MPLCHVYVRVSHIDQLNGVSLERQAFEGWKYYNLKLKELGVQEGRLFEERAISAWKVPLIKRAQGSILHDQLQPGDHVVFLRLDRAFRSVKDMSVTCSMWLDKGINIHFINPGIDMSTAFGRLQANIIAAVVQWESDMKSERLREAAAYRRAKYPHRPYGSSKSGCARMWLPSVNKGGELAYVPDNDLFEELMLGLRVKATGVSFYKAAKIMESARRKRVGLPEKIDIFRENKKDMWTPEKLSDFVKRIPNNMPLLQKFYGDRDEYYLHFTPESKEKGIKDIPPIQRKVVSDEH